VTRFDRVENSSIYGEKRDHPLNRRNAEDTTSGTFCSSTNGATIEYDASRDTAEATWTYPLTTTSRIHLLGHPRIRRLYNKSSHPSRISTEPSNHWERRSTRIGETHERTKGRSRTIKGKSRISMHSSYARIARETKMVVSNRQQRREDPHQFGKRDLEQLRQTCTAILDVSTNRNTPIPRQT